MLMTNTSNPTFEVGAVIKHPLLGEVTLVRCLHTGAVTEYWEMDKAGQIYYHWLAVGRNYSIHRKG